MKQKEIWLINIDNNINNAKPCVILNDDSVSILPLKFIAPINEYKDKYENVPWMVKTSPNNKNNLSSYSVIDVFQTRSISEKKLVKKIGEISDEVLYEINNSIKIVFGLE